MKKKVLGTLIVACVLALSLGLFGCAEKTNTSDSSNNTNAGEVVTKESPANELIGTWKPTSIISGGIEVSGEELKEYLADYPDDYVALYFKEGGVVDVKFGGTSTEATYTYDGASGVIDDGIDPISFTYENEVLITDLDDGDSFHFVKE